MRRKYESLRPPEETEALAEPLEGGPLMGAAPSFSYSGDPAASEKDAVRFEIPDTEEGEMLISDEEIAYALTQESGTIGAAAHCCEALARRFTMQADLATGDVKVTYSAQAENLAERAGELRLKAAGAHAPYSGNQSAASKERMAEDEDRVEPSFSRRQFDSPYNAGDVG